MATHFGSFRVMLYPATECTGNHLVAPTGPERGNSEVDSASDEIQCIVHPAVLTGGGKLAGTADHERMDTVEEVSVESVTNDVHWEQLPGLQHAPFEEASLFLEFHVLGRTCLKQKDAES